MKAGVLSGVLERLQNLTLVTVRWDRKFLATPKHLRPVKKERPKKPKKVDPAYSPDDPDSVERHFRRVSNALKVWLAEERMVLNEIEYVLYEAGKRLYFGWGKVKDLPVPHKDQQSCLM